MRKIIVAVRQSMDGVIEAPAGPIEDMTDGFVLAGWSTTFWDDKAAAVYDGIFGTPFDLLLGRKTYEIFAGYWPHHTEGFVIAEGIAKANKYVLTHRDDAFDWADTFRLRGMDDMKKLKASEGRDLLVQGSASLVPQLLAERLIDELCIMTFPVVLGNGKRLFGSGAASGAFRLVSSEISTTGIIIANYELSGDVPTGEKA